MDLPVGDKVNGKIHQRHRGGEVNHVPKAKDVGVEAAKEREKANQKATNIQDSHLLHHGNLRRRPCNPWG